MRRSFAPQLPLPMPTYSDSVPGWSSSEHTAPQSMPEPLTPPTTLPPAELATSSETGGLSNSASAGAADTAANTQHVHSARSSRAFIGEGLRVGQGSGKTRRYGRLPAAETASRTIPPRPFGRGG